MEHRWGTRHSLDVSVRLDGRPQLLTFARLKNASASGAYVETRSGPAMLSRVWVEIDGHLHCRNDFNRVAAYVVRKDEQGVGLEWCDFAPRAILALIERPRRLVARGRRDVVSEEIPRLIAAGSRSIATNGLSAQYAAARNLPAIAGPG
ncbi:MAG: PilZ domain-containing protein [Steroidobacteraceae bacterium]